MAWWVGACPALRAWQRRALVGYLRRRSPGFRVVATPGGGKTTFALRIAAELLGAGTVERVTVVTPTEHLKGQWAAAAASVRIHSQNDTSCAVANTVAAVEAGVRHFQCTA